MPTDTEAIDAADAGADLDDSTVDLEWLSLDDGEEAVRAGGPDRRTLLPALAIGIPLSTS